MSAKQGGSFATLLLAIPLSAIPLMAIFGIPEFTHLAAATQDSDPPDLVRQAVASFDAPAPAPQTADDRHRLAAADLLSPASGEPPHTPLDDRSGTFQQAALPSVEQHQAVTSDPPQPSPRPMQTAAPAPLIRTLGGSAASPPPDATASGLTWREATRRLEEVGITDYRLQRSESLERYLFCCRFSPGGDERIVQRFEAESVEPLDAVENVLGQVERWLQRRYADSRKWIP